MATLGGSIPTSTFTLPPSYFRDRRTCIHVSFLEARGEVSQIQILAFRAASARLQAANTPSEAWVPVVQRLIDRFDDLLQVRLSLLRDSLLEDGDSTDTTATSADDKKDEELYELIKLFVDTLDQIDRNYVRDVNRRELVDGAIQGMLEKLDKHSNYIPPSNVDRFKSRVENEFGGIGIRLSTTRAVNQRSLLRCMAVQPTTPGYALETSSNPSMALPPLDYRPLIL